MYLYAHLPNGDKLFSRRVAETSWEKTRALLAEHFPGARILSPLEARTVDEHGGTETRFMIVTVYGSQTPDGRARCTSFDQWGVQTVRMQQAAPAEPAGRLSQDEIRHMADHVARWTFKHLIETTTISRPDALYIAAGAGDRYAQELERATSKITGVTE